MNSSWPRRVSGRMRMPEPSTLPPRNFRPSPRKMKHPAREAKFDARQGQFHTRRAGNPPRTRDFSTRHPRPHACETQFHTRGPDRRTRAKPRPTKRSRPAQGRAAPKMADATRPTQPHPTTHVPPDVAWHIRCSQGQCAHRTGCSKQHPVARIRCHRPRVVGATCRLSNPSRMGR